WESSDRRSPAPRGRGRRAAGANRSPRSGNNAGACVPSSSCECVRPRLHLSNELTSPQGDEGALGGNGYQNPKARRLALGLGLSPLLAFLLPFLRPFFR